MNKPENQAAIDLTADLLYNILIKERTVNQKDIISIRNYAAGYHPSEYRKRKLRGKK